MSGMIAMWAAYIHFSIHSIKLVCGYWDEYFGCEYPVA